MTTRIHRPVKVIAFNGNDTEKRGFELTKQLQDQGINVTFLSEEHLKPRERSLFPNYQVYWRDRLSGLKGGTLVAVRKCIPHN